MLTEKERYVVQPCGQRPKNVYTYWVTGKGHFPFDMLRYDSAYPACQDDASVITDNNFSARRSIKLRSHNMPTIDRWSSFGWSVGAKKLY